MDSALRVVEELLLDRHYRGAIAMVGAESFALPEAAVALIERALHAGGVQPLDPSEHALASELLELGVLRRSPGAEPAGAGRPISAAAGAPQAQDAALSAALEPLVAAYGAFHRQAGGDERKLLSDICSQLLVALDSPETAASSVRRQAFEFVIRLATSARRQAFARVERPDWLCAELLGELRADAELQLRAGVRGTRSWQADVGDAARLRLLGERGFIRWLCAELGIGPAGLGREVAFSYLLYDRPGDHCPIHVDNPRTHAINCLICLDYTPAAGLAAGSLLRLYEPEGLRELALRPGDVVLFNADSLPHARSPLGPQERVLLLSLGFSWG